MVIEVSCSYSHKDDYWKNKLEEHLALSIKSGLIKFWDACEILAGSHRQSEIDTHFDTAKIILILISSNYLASSYHYDQMEVALKKKKNDGTNVVPIIINQCDWKKTSIASLQVLPRDKKPLNSVPDKDEALNEIVNEINRVVDRIRISHHNEEITSPIDGIEFVNRDRILKKIMSTYPASYLLISAPPGYGKTRLLKVAKFRLEKEQDWYCINLILSRKYEYSIKQFTLKLLKAFKISDEEITILEIDLTAEKYGKYLGIKVVNFLKKLKQKKTNIKDKFCILIDQAEVLDYPHKKEDSLIQEIFGKFLPAMSDVMKEKNQNIRWRFIFSGRYISEWENKIKKKIIPLKTDELELFEPETIIDAIYKSMVRTVFEILKSRFIKDFQYCAILHDELIAS